MMLQEPKKLVEFSPDKQFCRIDGSTAFLPVAEVKVDTDWLDDDGLHAWAKDLGRRLSLSIGFAPLQEYNGTKLTKFNSQAMEQEYMADLAKQGKEWIKEAPESRTQDDWDRHVLQTELYVLVKFALGYDKLEFYVHYPICRFMQAIHPGGRAHVQMPRATYKTTICTIGYSIQTILKNPNVLILVKSHEEDAAKDKLREARDRMHQSQDIQRLFPQFLSTGALVGATWTCPARTEAHAEATLNYAGGKQGKVGYHYDLILGDDVWDENSVQSERTLHTCFRNVANIKYLRKDASTIIVFIDTRWSHDDPTELLRKNRMYRHLIVSAIDNQGQSIFVPLRPDGGGYTLRDLHGQHAEDEYCYACQMMLNPVSEAGGFQDAWFNWLSYNDVQKAAAEGQLKYRNVLLYDLAGTANNKSDFNAAGVLCCDSLGRRIFVAVFRRKCTPFEFTELLFQIADRFGVQMMCGQKASVESHHRPEFDRINRERSAAGRQTYNLYSYSLSGANSNKTSRIRSLMAPMQQGIVYFNADPGDHTADIPHLISQLQKFPYVQNDDLADMAAMQNDPQIHQQPQHVPAVAQPKVIPVQRDDVQAIIADFKRDQVEAAFAYVESEEDADYDNPFYY